VSARLDIADVKAAAQARVFDVLAALGVKDKPSSGGYISTCNPVVKDRHPSFTIWVRGAAIGAWKDHRDDATKGDIIDLVSYLKGWWGLRNKGRAEALRWLIDFLGLERVPPAQLASDRAKSRRRQAELVKKRDEELATKQGRAFELWLEARPIMGSLGQVYLARRSIDLRELPLGPRGGSRVPSILRFLPHHKHTESGRSLPCVVAGCVDGNGEIKAIHRTWLDPLGRDKADVTPNKKVWPDFGGLIIPLWRGNTNLSIKAAIAAGLREPLVLTEGVEDGLTAILNAPQFRTWAFISLGNLAAIALPECVDSVMLHRQNEWANRAAVSTFERGKAALEAQGRPVIEVKAMIGKDLNDTQRGAA
jgi:hypothetical protein